MHFIKFVIIDENDKKKHYETIVVIKKDNTVQETNISITEISVSQDLA